MKSWSQTNSAPKIPSWPDTSSLPGRQTEPCSNSMFRTSILSWQSPEVQVHCHVSTEHWTNTSNTWFSSFPRDQELDWWLLQTWIVRLGRNVDKSWTECMTRTPNPPALPGKTGWVDTHTRRWLWSSQEHKVPFALRFFYFLWIPSLQTACLIVSLRLGTEQLKNILSKRPV